MLTIHSFERTLYYSPKFMKNTILVVITYHVRTFYPDFIVSNKFKAIVKGIISIPLINTFRHK